MKGIFWRCASFTCATPVTVSATPSAVSTSSHLGCRVIISRVNLWETQRKEKNKPKKLGVWSMGGTERSEGGSENNVEKNRMAR